MGSNVLIGECNKNFKFGMLNFELRINSLKGLNTNNLKEYLNNRLKAKVNYKRKVMANRLFYHSIILSFRVGIERRSGKDSSGKPAAGGLVGGRTWSG